MFGNLLRVDFRSEIVDKRGLVASSEFCRPQKIQIDRTGHNTPIANLLVLNKASGEFGIFLCKFDASLKSDLKAIDITPTKPTRFVDSDKAVKKFHVLSMESTGESGMPQGQFNLLFPSETCISALPVPVHVSQEVSGPSGSKLVLRPCEFDDYQHKWRPEHHKGKTYSIVNGAGWKSAKFISSETKELDVSATLDASKCGVAALSDARGQTLIDRLAFPKTFCATCAYICNK